MRILREKYLSASALQNYLACPAKFYYHSVCGLKEQDEVSESLEANDIGNVFHAAMQQLYDVPGGTVTQAYLRSLLQGTRIKDTVRPQVLEALHSFEVSGRNIIFEDLVCRCVRKAVERDIALLEGDIRKS